MSKCTIYVGDALSVLKTLPDNSIHCSVSSPPYWTQRSYGNQCSGELGWEPTVNEYIDNLVSIYAEVRRVLRKDGLCFINIGDTRIGGNRGHQTPKQKSNVGSNVPKQPKQGIPKKNLALVPERLSIALQDDGWIVRNHIVWEKTNGFPSSALDRFTDSHEHICWIIPPDDPNYRDGYSQWGKMIKTGKTRNRRTVWSFAIANFKGDHYATFPVDLPRLCILAGCLQDGVALDSFGGAGTTGLAASILERDSILIELNPDYAKIAYNRILGDAPLFNQAEIVTHGK